VREGSVVAEIMYLLLSVLVKEDGWGMLSRIGPLKVGVVVEARDAMAVLRSEALRQPQAGQG